MTKKSRLDKLQDLKKSIQDKKSQKILSRINLLPQTSEEIYHHAQLCANGNPPDKSEIHLKEISLIEFELGFRENHDLSEKDLTDVLNNWMREFLTQWFTDAHMTDLFRIDDLIPNFSRKTILELRNAVYKEKYWNRPEFVYYRHIEYFIYLFQAFLKGNKVNDQTARQVNFEKLFSKKTFLELKQIPLK